MTDRDTKLPGITIYFATIICTCGWRAGGFVMAMEPLTPEMEKDIRDWLAIQDALYAEGHD